MATTKRADGASGKGAAKRASKRGGKASRKRRAKRAPAETSPVETEANETKANESGPAERNTSGLSGGALLFAGLPALAMVLLSLLPALAEREQVRLHTWIAAGLSLLATFAVVRSLRARGEAPGVDVVLRRPHYMQAITQGGVFVYWGMYWAPVKEYAWLILIQVALAYQADMLLAWWRNKRWSLGFGPFPIVFSINLFMWFKDGYFGWQLLLVALAYAGKWLITWQRDGRRRHIFNPSSFGLGGVSLVLLLTGTSALTWGREIALTQEDPRYIFEVLFALGLIVQLQFPVVLVTASAAITTWLLGALWLRITGVYMFGTTDIPAAVFLGMLLLVTDPATSPKGRMAKVLFGAAYGFLAFALYPILEALGSYGYYDKLLPVPILNLLVRHFDRWGQALQARFVAAQERAASALRQRLVHVGAWAGIFVLLLATDAVSAEHPGRQIVFWQRACESKRFTGCEMYFKLLTSACTGGKGEACHNLGVELLEREANGVSVVGRGSVFWLSKACELGIAQSCQLRARAVGSASPGAGVASPGAGAGVPGAGAGVPGAGAGVPGAGAGVPGDMQPGAAVDPLAAMLQVCDSADGSACHQLAHLYAQGAPGLPPDVARARAFYQRGCDLGLARSCNSVAALAMQSGESADTEVARQAFDKSCKADDASGCSNLALMYLTGRGVEKDEARAARLHDKACGLKLAVACFRLADAYRKGQGVEVDEARVAALVQQACALGYAPACGGATP